MFATEENIKRLKRAQEMQERLDKLQNCPCLSLAEEEKMKREINDILDRLRYDELKNFGLNAEPEKDCKHVFVLDKPMTDDRFKVDRRFKTMYGMKHRTLNEVIVYKCVNCGGNFVTDLDNKYMYPLIFNALGQISLGKEIDSKQYPVTNIFNDNRTDYYKSLFENQNSILYLRAVSMLDKEATSIEILELMEKLNADDNEKLDAVYKDIATKIKNVTFGL